MGLLAGYLLRDKTSFLVILENRMQGKKVLLVDADPQGDLTTCLGWQDTDSLPQTLSNKLSAVMREEQQDPFSGILSHEEKVDLVPSNLDLSALEMSLVTAMSRESVMKNYLSQVKDRYDYVLIDCMPSLGIYEIYKTGALYLAGFNIEQKINFVIMYLHSTGM